MKKLILIITLGISLNASAQSLDNRIVKRVESHTEFVMSNAQTIWVVYVLYKNVSIAKRYEFETKKEYKAFKKLAKKRKNKQLK